MFLNYVSPLVFKPLPERLLVGLLEDKQKSWSGGVIYHGFYPFLAMIYRCFQIHYIFFGVFLVCFQVLE